MVKRQALCPLLLSKSPAERCKFPTGGRLRGCLVHRLGQDVAKLVLWRLRKSFEEGSPPTVSRKSVQSLVAAAPGYPHLDLHP